ncbi:hypothetical protein I2I11_17825 [Pontibacter sp. 172403-2]|uniref:hypothetical protein n=1 Tax=Pontibacter rufus TaxID=2791028 RepID=UPI0018B01015|nr:hypothetical protein [Pontibacter sp. 172403-2]MBF9255162.1 hypothetical protein [Pontibacter sp. 172403-2]
MKKFLYVAAALLASSCSTENDLQDTLYDVAESSANMALDSLHNAVNKELERHTGIDSLVTKMKAADTINLEREIEQEIIEQLSK